MKVDFGFQSGFDVQHQPFHAFSERLTSQNMYAASRSASSHPRDYGAVPIELATPNDSYVYKGDVVMVNAQLPQLAQHPAIVMKNELDQFRSQLPEGNAYDPPKAIAKIYFQNIDELLTIPSNSQEYYSYESAVGSRDFEIGQTKDHANFLNSIVDNAFEYTRRSNLNRVEGKSADTTRKGIPALTSLATIQAARLKAEGHDLSEWETHTQYGDLIKGYFRHLGTFEEQVGKSVDYINSPEFTPDQREEVISAINDRFEPATNSQREEEGWPYFTIDNFGSSKKLLVEKIREFFPTLEEPFSKFFRTIQAKVEDNSPLQKYHHTATFNEIRQSLVKYEILQQLKPILNKVPINQIDEIIDDLVNIVEPLRQKFKKDHHEY